MNGKYFFIISNNRTLGACGHIEIAHVSLNIPWFLYIMLWPSEVVLIRLQKALISSDKLMPKLEYAKAWE